MIRDLKLLTHQPYDLLVIGGGINGAAIANMAAGEGLSVALLEKKDFASGTSSKSTKLAHGGIRYLENLEFDLVHEALRERYIQFKNVPHLVKPLPFIIPVYKDDQRPLWLMKLGVFLYDLLSGAYNLGRHRSLSVAQTLTEEPNLRRENLLGAVLYFDAQIDDARICLENVLSADQKGAHVANYVEVSSFLKADGKVVGVNAKDHLTGAEFEMRAQKIVCATGPWSDDLRLRDNPRASQEIRTTKGVHLVYKGQISKHAILIQSKKDKRIFFVIPWLGNTLIGTTDTDYAGNFDDVKVEDQDIDYLFKEAARVFPAVSFERGNLITTFAGLRPLVYHPGHPSKISRQHVIEQSPSGVVYVMGGKYTTYRKIDEDCLKVITGKALSKRRGPLDYPLYGSGAIKESLDDVSRQFEIDSVFVQSLREKYGTRYLDVLQLTKKDASLKNRICTCSHTIKAQIIYARDVEMAHTNEDVINRRLGLQYLPCPTGNCRRAVEQN